MKKNKIKGFGDVLVTENIIEGVSCLVQVNELLFQHSNTVYTWYPYVTLKQQR